MKGLTKEDIKEFMQELHKEASVDLPQRQVVIAAGKGFHDLFEHTLERENNISLLEWLFEVKAVTGNEKSTILAMLKSKDMENYELAKAFLSEKVKNRKDGLSEVSFM